MQNPKTQYFLRGFSHVMGLRVFTFEGVAADRTRTVFTVEADLALTRRYGIQQQELPLLCRGVLDRCEEGEQKRAFAYTEDEMRLHAGRARERELAAKQKKQRRRPPSESLGAAWRAPQQ